MIRVYVDMAADMFHIGHLNLIKRSKELGDYLVVGVHSDKEIASYKRKPIIEETQRYEIVRSCKYVDEVIEAAPLVITEEFLNKHSLDIVVHGDDISEEVARQHVIPVAKGIVEYLPRTEGTSTTNIIERIKERIKDENN